MSWWINSPSVYKNQVLAFKVQWFLHKWYVYISLDLDDTFRVTLTKRNMTTIVKQFIWVYLEDLIDLIDRNVEKDWDDLLYKNNVMGTCVAFK